GALEIVDEDLFRLAAPILRNLAGETVDRQPADGRDVVERLREGRAPFVLPARNGAEAELGLAARRRVDAEHLDVVALDGALEVGGRDTVGKTAFNRLEAGLRRGIDALKERTVLEQIAEMGGKAGHAVLPCARPRGRID